MGYKQRREPCRTINCHKQNCHHGTPTSYVKTTLLMGHSGGILAAALLLARGTGASCKAGKGETPGPGLHHHLQFLPSPYQGLGHPPGFSWHPEHQPPTPDDETLLKRYEVSSGPKAPKASKHFGQPSHVVLDAFVGVVPLWAGTCLKMLVFTPGIRWDKLAPRGAHCRSLQLLIFFPCQGCISVGPHIPPSPSAQELQSQKKCRNNSGELSQRLYKDGLVLIMRLGDFSWEDEATRSGIT